MAKTYTISVFNTCTSQYETIEVTEDVYNEFRRGEWRIAKNEDKHNANETPFSQLTGGEDGLCENFHEFINTDDTPETVLFRELALEELNLAINLLDTPDRELIYAIYYEGLTMREYAVKIGKPLMTTQDQKTRALKRLRNFLRNI